MQSEKRLNHYQECSQKDIAAAERAVNRLFAKFHPDFLAENSCIKASTYRSCKSRSKIGPFAATEVCKIKEVASAGFKRGDFCPDIIRWFDEK